MNKHVKEFIEKNASILNHSVQEFVTLFDIEKICIKNHDPDAAAEFFDLMYSTFEEFRNAYDSWAKSLNNNIDNIYNKYPYTTKLNKFFRFVFKLPKFNDDMARLVLMHDYVSNISITSPSKEILTLNDRLYSTGSRRVQYKYYLTITSSNGKSRTTDYFDDLFDVEIPNFGEFFTHESLKECIEDLEPFVKFMNDQVETAVLSFDWEKRAEDIVPLVKDMMLDYFSEYLTDCNVEVKHYDNRIDLCLTSAEFPEPTKSATVSIKFTEINPDKVNWKKELVKLKSRINRMQQKQM